jgi:GntR family transcriptional regulator
LLDLNSPLPLYVQLREILRRDIENGRYRIGEQIPAEQVIVKQYGVARATVRQAITDLVNEGLLSRRQGRGTFVCRQRRLDTIEPLISFTAEMTARGINPGARVLYAGKPEHVPAAAIDNLGENTPLFYAKRIRTADDVPIALEHSYIINSLAPEIHQADLSGSLYQILAYQYNIKITRVTQTVKSALPEEDQIKLLDIDGQTPVLIMERTLFTDKDRAFYWLRFIFHGGLYQMNTVYC